MGEVEIDQEKRKRGWEGPGRGRCMFFCICSFVYIADERGGPECSKTGRRFFIFIFDFSTPVDITCWSE